jgi:RNA polymerase subunit RPABC4/transcription elongation factor Spt4
MQTHYEACTRVEESVELETINFVCSRKEFPEEWKDCVIVPIYKKGNKTGCSNC